MDSPTITDRIGRVIQQVARGWRRSIDYGLQPLGLTEATWLPLLYLDRVGPVRQVDLADYLGLDRSSVVRLIDTLAGQGLVERQDDPGDRRAKRIVLTAAAGPIVTAATEVTRSVRHQALAGLEPAALEAAEAVLLQILGQLPKPMAECATEGDGE